MKSDLKDHGSKKQPVAMILAAGKGTRMRPLTLQTPKPLLLAAGKPLIVWHIERLVKAGFKRLVINHYWLGEQLELAIGDGSRWGVHIDWSAEDLLLNTGGGILNALPLLGDDPFLLVNGDVFTDMDFSAFISSEGMVVLPAGILAHLLMVDNPEHNPEGDFSLENDQIRNGGEAALTFSGVSLIRPQLFFAEKPGSFPLTPLLKQCMNQGKVSGEYYQGYWLDVGTPERLKTLDNDLIAGRCGRQI